MVTERLQSMIEHRVTSPSLILTSKWSSLLKSLPAVNLPGGVTGWTVSPSVCTKLLASELKRQAATTLRESVMRAEALGDHARVLLRQRSSRLDGVNVFEDGAKDLDVSDGSASRRTGMTKLAGEKGVGRRSLRCEE